LFGSNDKVDFILRISEDVSARRAADDALRASEHRARTIADAMPAAVAYVDRQEVYRFTNSAFDRAFSYAHEIVEGHTVQEVMGAERYACVKPYIDRALAGESVTFERQEPGPVICRYVEVTYIPEFDESNDAVVGFHAMLQDVSAQRQESQRLLSLAQIDSLTGLANRAGLEQRLAETVADCGLTGKRLAVMYLDIDHFKQINDTLGHAAGDAMLLAFAARLRGSLRKGDTVARLGGDEFVVVMADTPDRAIARRQADKVLNEIRRPFALGESGTLNVTASIGVAFYEGGETATQLVARADAMLYKAKADGRDCFRLADPIADELKILSVVGE
jgi:diguanylate cyclase (GGDEF)-like protein/PAS domain S-box-containing protein